MKYSIILLSLLFSNYSFAQKEAPTGHALMSPAELELKIKAKKRLYPGGADEESLKVQAQMPQVTRKMAPVTEAPIEENEPEPSTEGM
jgi:hypothetical protein